MHRQLLLKIGKCKYDMCLDWRRFIVSFKRKYMFCCSRGLDHGLMLVKFSENCWLHETFCMKLNCAYRNINAIDMIAIQRHIEYLKLLVIFRKNDFNRIENPDRDLFHGENKSIGEPVINGSWNIVTSLTKTKQWIFFSDGWIEMYTVEFSNMSNYPSSVFTLLHTVGLSASHCMIQSSRSYLCLTKPQREVTET